MAIPVNEESESIQELLNSAEENNVILGATLAESILGWDYHTIVDKIGEAFHKTIIDSTDQEMICKMCEEDILDWSSMGPYFTCEGCKCEEANEIIIENYIESIL